MSPPALSPDAVVVTAVGAACPVGLDAPSAAAALAAGVSRLTDAPEVSVPAGPYGTEAEPAVAGRVAGLGASAADREAALLASAVAEAVGQCGAPVDLALVATGAALSATAAASVREAVGPDAEVVAEPGRLVQTAALDALARAADAVRQRRARRVLVAAAGSLSAPDALRALGQAGRLKSALLPDGLVPGEAGAALVVESAQSARERGAPALAVLLASGSGTEDGDRAEGLTAAVRGAAGTREDVGLVVADLNGTRRRARDWSLASTRALPYRRDTPDLWHPADAVGDAGTGAGALLLVIAALALARGAVPGVVLVVASDDGGARRAWALGPADRVRPAPPRPAPRTPLPDVVEEHAEEAAFLRAQRRYLAETGRATRDRLARIESRAEAHLLGLLVAGPEADGAVRSALEAGVPGAAYVAVRRLCQPGDPDRALALVTGLDARRFGEGVDALLDGAPPEWADAFAEGVASGDPQRVRVAAAVAGAARLPLGPALLHALARAPDAATAAPVVAALGALRYPPARTVLQGLLSAASDVGPAARRALVRFGDAQALHAARDGQTPSHALDVALLGDSTHGSGLAASARADHAGGPVALGVLGDSAHIPLLLDLLGASEAAGAALGLRVLTGAPLVEEALVLDDPADPDLGSGPVVRPSQSPDDWRAWWAEHGGALRPGVRYRAGRPFTPLVAITAPVGGLPDDLLPAPLRDALADELAGRYGLDAPFRADAPVAHQRAALAVLADAAAAVRPREGEWALARR